MAGLTGEGMDLSDIKEKIAKVPPIVWVGAGVIILFVFFLNKGAPDTSATADPTAGGDGGNFEPSIDQQISDLFALIRADADARAAFQAKLDALLKGGVPGGSGNTGGGGTGGSGNGGTPPTGGNSGPGGIGNWLGSGRYPGTGTISILPRVNTAPLPLRTFTSPRLPAPPPNVVSSGR